MIMVITCYSLFAICYLRCENLLSGLSFQFCLIILLFKYLRNNNNICCDIDDNNNNNNGDEEEENKVIEGVE